MSLFITFEGGEGSGKSTQARALYRRLSKRAIPVMLTHEPGVTPIGKRISRWLKWTGDTGITPLSELLLFNASRSQLITEVIMPGLKNGKIIICDRYIDSTTVYQSYGRGLDSATVTFVNNLASRELKPDMTILLDIPAEAGLARQKGKKQDRFEHEEASFHRRIREGYLKLAAAEPERWLVVDARQPKAKIGELIWEKVSRLISERGLTHG